MLSVISFSCYCNFLLEDKDICLTSVLNVATSVDGTGYVIVSLFKPSIYKKFRCSTKQNTRKVSYWLSTEIYYVRLLKQTKGLASLCLPCTFIIRHISLLSIGPKCHILIGLNKAYDWRSCFYVRLLIIHCRRSTSLFRHFILTYLIQKLLPYRFLLFEVVALWSDFLQVRIGNIWSSTDCVNILNQETTYSIVFALAISILLITHIFRWGYDYLVSLFHIFFFYKNLKDFDCVFTYQKYQNVLTENLF